MYYEYCKEVKSTFSENDAYNGSTIQLRKYIRWLELRLSDVVAQNSTSTNRAKVQICPRCGGSGRLYNHWSDGEGSCCPNCGGSGKL